MIRDASSRLVSNASAIAKCYKGHLAIERPFVSTTVEANQRRNFR